MDPAQRNRNICVVLDANILITLLNMDRLELLAGLKGHEFCVPDQVVEEIHRKVQRERLREAIRVGWLKEIEVTDIAEIEMYAKYRRRCGKSTRPCRAISRSRRSYITRVLSRRGAAGQG